MKISVINISWLMIEESYKIIVIGLIIIAKNYLNILFVVQFTQNQNVKLRNVFGIKLVALI